METLYGRPDMLGQLELFDLNPKDCAEDYMIKLSTILEETEVLLRGRLSSPTTVFWTVRSDDYITYIWTVRSDDYITYI